MHLHGSGEQAPAEATPLITALRGAGLIPLADGMGMYIPRRYHYWLSKLTSY